MNPLFNEARALLKEFKGDSYLFGNGVLDSVGSVAAKAGTRAALIYTSFPGVDAYVSRITSSIEKAGVKLAGVIEGAAPNAPLEDLSRITEELKKADPDVIVSFGGGSTIDAAKSAEVLRTLGGEINEYFGTGLVSEKLKETGKKLTPHIAIQTVASSAAHLTKYSNITDVRTGQKKLVVDPAVVPAYPVFDYEVTHTAPMSLTSDGALDGIAHIVEVFYGAVGKPYYGEMEKITKIGVPLVLKYLPVVLEDPSNVEAREALCLATDLGGYSIMIGGTNGGHLTSFSLVDVLSHGRACALMNPYYTVFFAPSIQEPLKTLAEIYASAGFMDKADVAASGAELGRKVAGAMIAFAQSIKFPVMLSEVNGFTDAHIERALVAAKNPQLKMKLENMPIPLTAEMIDDYMGPILQAAKSGNLELIRTVQG